MLVRLDSFVGQQRKLKNQWGSQIHTVICRVADGIPTYVVRNDKTKTEYVLHRAHLLLCMADHTDQEDGVSLNLAISAPAVVGTVKEGTKKNAGVSQDLSYGLSLAMFSAMICPPHHLTGPQAPAIQLGVLLKGDGQVTSVIEGNYPPMAREITLAEDVPPWREYSPGEASVNVTTLGFRNEWACCYKKALAFTHQCRLVT